MRMIGEAAATAAEAATLNITLYILNVYIACNQATDFENIYALKLIIKIVITKKIYKQSQYKQNRKFANQYNT